MGLLDLREVVSALSLVQIHLLASGRTRRCGADPHKERILLLRERR